MELNYVCNVGTKKFGDIDRIGGTEREKPKPESLRDCRCILISAHLRTRSRLKTASFRSGYSPPFPTIYLDLLESYFESLSPLTVSLL